MQPGSKIDSDETTQAALVRELKEELGISVDVQSLVPLGQFLAPAAHEAGVMVDAALFMVECDQTVQPAAEIEEAIWVEPDAPRDFPIALLTDSYVLPPAQAVSRPVRQSSRLSSWGKIGKARFAAASPQKEKGPTRVGPVWG
jgi:8-oxo-dGTP pyrophosphatase MutT (NUDIX family)